MPSIRSLAVLFAALVPLHAGAQSLTVSAAASLTDAFKEIGSRFEASHPGVTVRFNFAASGTLLQQISQGAPADVFASADQATMDRAVQQKLVDTATRVDFAANQLVVIEPASGGAGIKSLQDLAGSSVKRIAVGKPASVPAGRYAREVLDGAQQWNALEPRFVHADSVRQVLDYVSRGEVEAGFVYRTDAAIAGDKVRIAFTTTGHTPITYPIAVVADSKQAAAARAFINYVNAPDARTVLSRYGFSQP